jgi:hypothetical protein
VPAHQLVRIFALQLQIFRSHVHITTPQPVRFGH